MAKMLRKKSEDISDFVGYWFCEDGTIVDRSSGEPVTVYSSGIVRLTRKDGRKDTAVAHRLIAEAFVERPEGCNFVKFKDGQPSNRAASNLMWVFGVRDVSTRTLEILKCKQLGWSTAEIAFQFQKTPQYINRLLKEHAKRLQN